MPEPSMQFFVTCPECALESASDIPIAVIADGLLTGKSIRLYANCHDIYWTATFVERKQLRQFLGALQVPAEPQPASDSPDAMLPSCCLQSRRSAAIEVTGSDSLSLSHFSLRFD